MSLSLETIKDYDFANIASKISLAGPKGSRKINPPLMARPLRRGGGGKARAIKEKITFLKTFFLILLPFKN